MRHSKRDLGNFFYKQAPPVPKSFLDQNSTTAAKASEDKDGEWASKLAKMANVCWPLLKKNWDSKGPKKACANSTSSNQAAANIGEGVSTSTRFNWVPSTTGDGSCVLQRQIDSGCSCHQWYCSSFYTARAMQHSTWKSDSLQLQHMNTLLSKNWIAQ